MTHFIALFCHSGYTFHFKCKCCVCASCLFSMDQPISPTLPSALSCKRHYCITIIITQAAANHLLTCFELCTSITFPKCLYYSIILDNDQLAARLLYFILQYIYYNPLHVSSITCSSSGG